MLSVQEAEEIVLSHAIKLPSERIDFAASCGRILAENILADRDFPPFDRVMMDGIAFDLSAFKGFGTSFKIESVAQAGAEQKVLLNAENCIEVMTGAMLPKGCNVVVRYEDVSIQNDSAKVNIETISERQNIHSQGLDRKTNDVICEAGRSISPAEMGVLATVGQHEVSVLRRPIITVISTGDELVPITAQPLSHQIRSSNGYALCAVLRQHGVEAKYVHLPDDETLMLEGFRIALEKSDALVLSGGVSAGKFDFVPKVLKNLKVQEIFHKVSQRPGKPFWFGIDTFAKPVFALPGNPVSTFMCLHRYVLPWLKTSQGIKEDKKTVILAENYSFKPPLTMFLQVKIETQNGVLMAYPRPGNGSGDLANLVDADGFVELDLNQTLFEKGTVLRFFGYR